MEAPTFGLETLNQEYDPDLPSPLRLLVVANFPSLAPDNLAIREAVTRADLVVGLGGVNLHILADYMISDNQKGVAVIGPHDSQDIPARFPILHGAGFKFRKWLLAGISGAPNVNMGQSGMYLNEYESSLLLEPLHPANIFFSHSPPQRLNQSNIIKAHGMSAVDDYLLDKKPIYHFYAHPSESVAEEYGPDKATISIGVHNFMETPLLEYV